MSGFRPSQLLLCLVAVLALIGAFLQSAETMGCRTAEMHRALAAPAWGGPPVWHHGDLDVAGRAVDDAELGRRDDLDAAVASGQPFEIPLLHGIRRTDPALQYAELPCLQTLVQALLAGRPQVFRKATVWTTIPVEVIGNLLAVPQADRNLVLLLFRDPAVRRLLADWDATARMVVAQFRAFKRSWDSMPAIFMVTRESAPSFLTVTSIGVTAAISSTRTGSFRSFCSRNTPAVSGSPDGSPPASPSPSTSSRSASAPSRPSSWPSCPCGRNPTPGRDRPLRFLPWRGP